jgi:hypothetical protein
VDGRNIRRKGQAGEREVAAILAGHGFACRRDGRLNGDLVHDCHGYHFEVKRAERLKLPEWFAQAEADADRHGLQPVLAFRQSGQPWRAMVREDNPAFWHGATSSRPAGDPLELEALFVEARRLDLPRLLEQAERDAEGVPVLMFRRPGDPYKAVLPLEAFARLLAEERDRKQRRGGSHGRARG